MNKILFPGTLALITLAVASPGIGQETNNTACQQAIQTNCTICHATQRICAKLDIPGANWPATVAVMGKRGNLSKQVQDAVIVCLTTSANPKGLVCPTRTP